MYKHLLITAFVIVTFFSCSENFDKVISSSYPNGTPMKIEYYKQGDSAGQVVREVRFWENGEKESEINYSNGEKNGESILWYASGKKKSTYLYKDGMKQGAFTEWYENGEICFEGEYSNDTPSGKWKFWSENGELESEKSY